MTGHELHTYKGTSGNGGVITLTKPVSVLNFAVQSSGVFFVRPRTMAEGATPPSQSPDPSNDTDASGWIRVTGADEAVNMGGNRCPSLPPAIAPIALEVWCDTSGYLLVQGQ